MKLELKRRVLKIDMYGEEISLNFPTVGQFKLYEEKLRSKKESEVSVMTEFLEELGLPSGKLEILEPGHLSEIISSLVGDKKK